MAVQGAAPSKIMPAMYWLALAGSIRSAKTNSKNKTPNAAMVKGLSSQLTTRVITMPLGRSWMRLRLVKSTDTIIG